MKAVHYHLSTGRTNFELLSITLRIPYLLLDKLILASDANHYIYIELFFKRANLLQKLNLLENGYTRSGIHGELLFMVHELKDTIKKQKSVKHPDKTLIVAYNKLMKTADDLFKNWIEQLIACYKPNGLMEFQILDDDITFINQQIVPDNLNIKKYKQALTKTSDFAKSLLPAKTEDGKIIIVNKDFLHKDFLQKRKIYKLNDKEALDEKNIYLHKCFQFPLLISLNADELKSVRNKLRDSTIIFNEFVQKWYECFITENSSVHKINFFIKEIIPTILSIQQEINNNEILTFIKRTNTKEHKIVNVWIGEAPLSTIWSFYKYNRQITDEEYISLEKAIEDNPLLHSRVPIMVIDAEGVYPDVKENIIEFKEPEITNSRKFISIND